MQILNNFVSLSRPQMKLHSTSATTATPVLFTNTFCRVILFCYLSSSPDDSSDSVCLFFSYVIVRILCSLQRLPLAILFFTYHSLPYRHLYDWNRFTPCNALFQCTAICTDTAFKCTQKLINTMYCSVSSFTCDL